MVARVVGNLDISDAVDILGDILQQVSLHDLHMIDMVLNKYIGMVDFLLQSNNIVDMDNVKPGHGIVV